MLDDKTPHVAVVVQAVRSGPPLSPQIWGETKRGARKRKRERFSTSNAANPSKTSISALLNSKKGCGRLTAPSMDWRMAMSMLSITTLMVPCGLGQKAASLATMGRGSLTSQKKMDWGVTVSAPSIATLMGSCGLGQKVASLARAIASKI